MKTSTFTLFIAALLTVGSGAYAQETAAPANTSQGVVEEHFNVDVNNAPARAFFQGLVKDTHYNVLVSPGVNGTISLELKHVTVLDVLDAVRDLYGYDYRRVSTGFMILPATVQTRVFHLNYLDMQRAGMSQTSISSGQLTQNNNTRYGSGASGGNSTASTTPTSSSSGPEVVSTGTSVVTGSKSSFWKEIDANLKSMHSPASSWYAVRQPSFVILPSICIAPK
jgi:MSHA biogenesis protein MshL